MKKLTILYFLLFSVYAIAQKTSISGTFSNYSGKDSLQIQIFSSDIPTVEKIFVNSKGKFTYDYNLANSNYCKLFFSPKDFILIIVSPDEKISITANAQKISDSYTITGSKDSELLCKNNSTVFAYLNEMTLRKAKYEKELDSLKKLKNEFIATTVKANKQSLSSLILVDLLDDPSYTNLILELDSSLFSLHPSNPVVKNFHNSIPREHSLKEGTIMPEISLQNQNGEIVSLSSLRGKVVLIDFWATWCRPCRMEIPTIKKAYAQYASKGFEVYSVSTDNNKDAWLKVIKDEQMPWITVHDATKKYSQDFQVKSIPFTILIDENGKIIAKNVRGGNLELLLSKHLN